MKINVNNHEDSGKEAEKASAQQEATKKPEAQAEPAEKQKDSQEVKKEPTPQEQIAALQAQVALLQAQLSVADQKSLHDAQTISQLNDKVQDWQDKYASMQRYASTMASDMKRMQSNTAMEIERAKEKILKDLLPTLDDFERALQAGKEDQSKDFEKMLEGVQMINDKMYQHLAGQFGLKKMETDGKPFDPSRHEALQMVKDDKYKDKTVTMTYQSGYLLGDKVIRPAKVVVSQPSN